MDDYISREAAIAETRKPHLTNAELRMRLATILAKIPAADVRPVVRGEWEQKEVFEANGNVDELQSAFCPVCQRYHTTPYTYYFTHYNFCPNCGAEMRGEEDV